MKTYGQTVSRNLQIDCEMAFVEQEDILNMFEGMIKSIFKEVKGIDYAEKCSA